ncbi:MAG TPA: hybrid sensor histidine kinase/response regulator [Aggregatilineales bacterium]|nr:hybrid sensor histidine kinase/response regulator [Aggregatilineales bacterium]
MNALPVILAVDDEPANLLLLQRLLHTQFQVICSPNGQTALAILDQTPIDLVLLDIMMPDLNGYQVLEQIRANPQTADLPVILISALGDSQDIAQGLHLGANDYISKPIDPDVTAARVQTQLALKQLQDERKKAFLELKAAQELKDRLIRIASHDLKSPLMNGRMITEFLRRPDLTPEDCAQWLTTLDDTLDSMKAVIEDFLDTAAASVGEIQIALDRVPLDGVVDDLLRLYQPHALRKNIRLLTEAMSGAVYADPARFRQALGNLVSNAIKYSPLHTQVHLWSVHEGQRVIICVGDEGPGIPANERSRLFTQFGKLSTRPTDGEHSTGLGLWIVKHLVGLQGGDVGVNCPPEGGSVFWIALNAA